MSSEFRGKEKDLFEFKSYKEFLLSLVGPKTMRKGVKGSIAKALRIQPTYVSQVLHGRAHLSLEQGEELSDFLGFTSEQKHYFLLLVQLERAGTSKLKKYFESQINELLAKRLVLTSRLGASNTLTDNDQTVYYSSWHYSAIHMALTIPELRTTKAISNFLCISLKRASEVIEFLIRAGLAQNNHTGFKVGNAAIRLGNNSPNIIKHHTNWRNQAIESLDRENLTDLHYSATVTLSQSDVIKLKNQMLEFIRSTISQVKDSKEEVLYSFCIDFFNLKKL